MIAPVTAPTSTATLAERLLAGDRRALARGISLVEDDRPEGWELVREVYPHTGRAAVVGFTGPPGVGKSTLIGALTRVRREAGRTVGVLSIDPSSPFTHGALLGDRIRLGEHFLDPGVFIRSMANRGALGGLSEAALQAALLLDAAGREDVFVETVGVGQAEVDIVDHADTVVLVLMPGSGDSIQALKAGVMEIPDVIVINKADHPLTDTMVREIRGVLSLANLDDAGGHRAGGTAPRAAMRRGTTRSGCAPRDGAGGCRSSGPRPFMAGGSPSWWSAWRSTARTSSPRGSSRSAGGATCGARCWRWRAPACAVAWKCSCVGTPSSSACWMRSWSAVWIRRAPPRRCWSGPPRGRRAWSPPPRAESRPEESSGGGNVGSVLFERFLNDVHLGGLWCRVKGLKSVWLSEGRPGKDVHKRLDCCR